MAIVIQSTGLYKPGERIVFTVNTTGDPESIDCSQTHVMFPNFYKVSVLPD